MKNFFKLVVLIAIFFIVLAAAYTFFTSGYLSLQFESEAVTAQPEPKAAQPTDVPKLAPAPKDCEGNLSVTIKFVCMLPPDSYPQGSVEELEVKETYQIMRHVHDDANAMWKNMFEAAGYSYIPSELNLDMDYNNFGGSKHSGIYFSGNTMVIPNVVAWGNEASELPSIYEADRYSMVMIIAYNVASHAIKQAVDPRISIDQELLRQSASYMAGIYFNSRVLNKGGYKPQVSYMGLEANNPYFVQGYDTGDPRNIPLNSLAK